MQNFDENNISFDLLNIDVELLSIIKGKWKAARLLMADCPTEAIIQLGSALEGLLLAIAQNNLQIFTNASNAPKDKNGKSKKLTHWKLFDLIEVAHEVDFIKSSTKRFGDDLRNYRNYIHPAKQLKEKFYPDQGTAHMCFEVVKTTIEDMMNTHNIKKRVEDNTIWHKHPDASFMALITLIGSWNENNENDIAIIEQLSGISYDDCLQKTQKILSLKNNIWQVNNRVELLKNLGTHIFDNHLDTFKDIAVIVLTELDPALDLPNNQRYTANIQGKILNYSPELRQGIAEGLAILGSNLEAISQCSSIKVNEILSSTIREIFNNNNWDIWASLTNLLPVLAEAHPNEFLNTIDATLKLDPCPFNELFARESAGIFGICYISGVLWALESLAWDSKYFSIVCLHLAKLANIDLGDQLDNRPFNSLRTILLPWLPQTLASVNDRITLMKSLVTEYPDVGWQLIIDLLPDSHQTSSHAHKPKWRNIIPVDKNEAVTKGEYLEQVIFYAKFAVNIAKNDATKLVELINHFDRLPPTAFDNFVEILKSTNIINLPENKKLHLWENLTKFIRQHKKYSSAKWAMKANKIAVLEETAKGITPEDTTNLYKNLFTNRESELYENDDFEQQRQNLNKKRETAIKAIFHQGGIDEVIKLVEIVDSPSVAGYALVSINNNLIEQKLLPSFLDSTNKQHLNFISAFIARCNQINGWQWSDNLDQSTWNNDQIAQFLAYLPFTQNTWNCAAKWLKDEEDKYWLCTTAWPYEDKDRKLTYAIDKLIKYNRPIAAIDCLYRMLYSEQSINVKQCIQALLSLNSSNKLDKNIDKYHIIRKLIEFIQNDTSVLEKDILEVEWLYLPLLDYNNEASPKFLENKLAKEPEFFLEVIKLCYKSTKPENTKKVPQLTATNAWNLLLNWRTPPGIKADGSFDEQHFTNWLEKAKTLCKQAGYLKVALRYIGQALFYVPKDSSNLWINETVSQTINADDAEEIRIGFRNIIYNSRGVYWVDKTGKAEQDMAQNWLVKAKELEKHGYLRFANTLKNLAKNYEWNAKRTVDKHQDEEYSD